MPLTAATRPRQFYKAALILRIVGGCTSHGLQFLQLERNDQSSICSEPIRIQSAIGLPPPPVMDSGEWCDWEQYFVGDEDNVLSALQETAVAAAPGAKHALDGSHQDNTPLVTRLAAEPRSRSLTPRSLWFESGESLGLFDWREATQQSPISFDPWCTVPFASRVAKSGEHADLQEEEAHLLAALEAVRAKKRTRPSNREKDAAIGKAAGKQSRGRPRNTKHTKPTKPTKPTKATKASTPSNPATPPRPSTPPMSERPAATAAATLQPPLPCDKNAPAPADAWKGPAGFVPFEKLVAPQWSCWPYTRLRVRIVA